VLARLEDAIDIRHHGVSVEVVHVKGGVDELLRVRLRET
jgi:hypothetical protein